MDRIKQKAQNCLATASRQAGQASNMLAFPNVTEIHDANLIEAHGLLQSALANLERARRGFSGVDLDHTFVNELAREIDAEGGPVRPATWHDVMDFVVHLSVPRIRRAWNLAMVVLAEEA